MAVPIDLVVNQTLTRDTKPILFDVDGHEFRFCPRKWEAIVWVSLTVRDARRQSLDRPPRDQRHFPVTVFPCLLDTGFNESFLMHQWHLENWARIPLSEFQAAGKNKALLGHSCPTISVDVWFHPLPAIRANQWPIEQAIKLETSGGAIVSLIRTSQAFPYRPAPRRSSVWRKLLSLVYQQRSTDPDPVDAWTQAAMDHQTDSVPFDVYPRIPLIGMKSVHTNRLSVELDGKNGWFSIRRTR